MIKIVAALCMAALASAVQLDAQLGTLESQDELKARFIEEYLSEHWKTPKVQKQIISTVQALAKEAKIAGLEGAVDTDFCKYWGTKTYSNSVAVKCSQYAP